MRIGRLVMARRPERVGDTAHAPPGRLRIAKHEPAVSDGRCMASRRTLMTYTVKPLSFEPTDNAEGAVREADPQPLGEQLRRRRPPSERDHGAAGRGRLRHGADIRDQRPEARGADRDELDDPARAVL